MLAASATYLHVRLLVRSLAAAAVYCSYWHAGWPTKVSYAGGIGHSGLAKACPTHIAVQTQFKCSNLLYNAHLKTMRTEHFVRIAQSFLQQAFPFLL